MMEYVPWCWVYFYTYIAVGGLVLMNLVTAIIVENAMANSAHDQEHQMREKEQKRKKEISELANLFYNMDLDGNGTLCWDEFQSSFQDTAMKRKWMMLDFSSEDCRDLFSMLDDGDGEIELEEFFEGLPRIQGQALSKDIFRVQKDLSRVLHLVEDLMVEKGSEKRHAFATAKEKPQLKRGF